MARHASPFDRAGAVGGIVVLFAVAIHVAADAIAFRAERSLCEAGGGVAVQPFMTRPTCFARSAVVVLPKAKR